MQQQQRYHPELKWILYPCSDVVYCFVFTMLDNTIIQWIGWKWGAALRTMTSALAKNDYLDYENEENWVGEWSSCETAGIYVYSFARHSTQHTAQIIWICLQFQLRCGTTNIWFSEYKFNTGAFSAGTGWLIMKPDGICFMRLYWRNGFYTEVVESDEWQTVI